MKGLIILMLCLYFFTGSSCQSICKNKGENCGIDVGYCCSGLACKPNGIDKEIENGRLIKGSCKDLLEDINLETFGQTLVQDKAICGGPGDACGGYSIFPCCATLHCSANGGSFGFGSQIGGIGNCYV